MLPFSVSKTLLSLDDVTSIQRVGQCCHLAPPNLKNGHVISNNFHVSTCFHSREKNEETSQLECTTYYVCSLLAYLLTYLLTPNKRVLLEKLTCFQLMKKFPAFMEPEGSLPPSEVPATCPYPEPARSSPYPHILIPITLIIFCENGGLKILVAFFR